MAKVIAPFLSQTAKGHFGGVMTAYRHTGRAYIMGKKKRRGLFVEHGASYGCSSYGGSFYGLPTTSYTTRGSLLQGVQRNNFSEGWGAYALLTPAQKELLSDEARSLDMTGANLFMSRWLQSHRA